MFEKDLPLDARDKEKSIEGSGDGEFTRRLRGGTRGGECNDVADNAMPGKGRKKARNCRDSIRYPINVVNRPLRRRLREKRIRALPAATRKKLRGRCWARPERREG